MNRFNFFVVVVFVPPLMFPMTLYCKCATYQYSLYVVGI